ncbi:protein of unknown function [Brochothrix thermosphacta]|uniref:Uncharacterized protein n=1 Tax=Brochothrix thermosphacta TaxID=2756 RepID=A0A2X0QDC0_BROTH|nr:hypothetical protein BTH160X_50004 [Brochothrix thermosphacta]SPN72348.1 protein of unknown function [Brochothrix thermosphacta]SPN76793.1 hypothetical protein BTEBP_90118 [Brochothrix thermosphacta]SPP25533.1 hypothetical protein BTTAP_10007 [Brochothrix thermosphacta]SPP26646.1 hypothetical protein BTBSAS_100115 [Brochothrix thermosphacta]
MSLFSDIIIVMTNERGFITHAVYFTYRSYDRIVLLYADSSATKASEKSTINAKCA